MCKKIYKIQLKQAKPTPCTVFPLCVLNFLPLEGELRAQVAAKLCQLLYQNLAFETVTLKEEEKRMETGNKDMGVQ